MIQKPIITLLSDFGITDSYVAEMKAVIISINPKATLIDITHQIPKYDTKIGSYILAKAVEYFPKGTIHLAVIDPEVGSSRRPIILEAKNATLVGPDNGLLIPAAEKLGLKNVYKIENRRYMNPEISSTFHGRDIFAPAAAFISLGEKPSDFGKKITSYVKPSFICPKISEHIVEGEIIYIDRFGNLVTNIKLENIKNKLSKKESKFKVYIENKKQISLNLSEIYCEVPVGAILALTGSGGFIEISANRMSAAEKLKAEVGMKVKFKF